MAPVVEGHELTPPVEGAPTWRIVALDRGRSTRHPPGLPGRKLATRSLEGSESMWCSELSTAQLEQAERRGSAVSRWLQAYGGGDPMSPEAADGPTGGAPPPNEGESVRPTGVESLLERPEQSTFPPQARPSGAVSVYERLPFSEFTVGPRRPSSTISALELPRRCTQTPIVDTIYDFARHRRDLCLVNLGFTMEPSVPGMLDYDQPMPARNAIYELSSPGVLRAAVSPADLLPWSLDRVLESHLPALLSATATRQAEQGPILGRLEVPDRPLKPGLIFPRDVVLDGFALARQILYAMPEIWAPASTLRMCGFEGGSTRAVMSEVQRIDLLVSRTADRKLVRLSRPAATVLDDGRLRMHASTNFGGKALARALSGRGRIHTSNALDQSCFIADYYFYWSALTGAAADRALTATPSEGLHSEGLEHERRRIISDWYSLMSDLCARVGLAAIVEVAAILAHEYLHFGAGNHCTLNGRQLGCCHYRIMGAVVAGLHHIFGLGFAFGSDAALTWGPDTKDRVKLDDRGAAQAWNASVLAGVGRVSSIGGYQISNRLNLVPNPSSRFGPFFSTWGPRPRQSRGDLMLDDRYMANDQLTCGDRDIASRTATVRWTWRRMGLEPRSSIFFEGSTDNQRCGGPSPYSLSIGGRST
jgi:hypothetical protein